MIILITHFSLYIDHIALRIVIRPVCLQYVSVDVDNANRYLGHRGVITLNATNIQARSRVVIDPRLPSSRPHRSSTHLFIVSPYATINPTYTLRTSIE